MKTLKSTWQFRPMRRPDQDTITAHARAHPEGKGGAWVVRTGSTGKVGCLVLGTVLVRTPRRQSRTPASCQERSRSRHSSKITMAATEHGGSVMRLGSNGARADESCGHHSRHRRLRSTLGKR